MDSDQFRAQFLPQLEAIRDVLTAENGDWAVKGFIDVYRNIYTISADTKVISKLIELMIFPILARFARENDYRMVLSEHQNHYPDISFIAPDETKFALDLKSTYRLNDTMVSGFTLGAFTGYFRQRMSLKNITFPYSDYAAHFVLGVIYTRTDKPDDERLVHRLSELEQIASVVGDFDFVFQEKWRIAHDHPGSGNTKNIGSERAIAALTAGNGVFAPHGRGVFDDYWMNYLTPDMARAIDSTVPYRNLAEYLAWRER